MKALDVVILAAGKGERMVSDMPKVLHEIMGKAMIDHVIEAAAKLGPEQIIVVTGHGREKVESHLAGKPAQCVVQKEQKGTAHALLSAGSLIGKRDILVLYGDVPLIETALLERFLAFYEKEQCILFMTTDVDNPAGYGRVITEGDVIVEIKEDADATPEEKLIRQINTGICIIPLSAYGYIKEIDASNKKGEHYLTDICKVARSKGKIVKAYQHDICDEVLGVNSRKELMGANRTMRMKILDSHMKKGVTIYDDTVYIESDVEIGRDTVIMPNSHILGKTVVGKHVSIGPNVVIRDSVIHDNVVVEPFTVMEGARLDADVKAGPFSRLRPKAVIEKGAKVGNFVEVKNTVLGEGSKVNHLTYLGDARIGKDVNIGAGTITCNYDGVNKHMTILEDNVFVGSNTELVAPVTVGKDAVIGAGSTITRNVPEGTLAVSRARQKHITEFVRRKKCAE